MGLASGRRGCLRYHVTDACPSLALLPLAFPSPLGGLAAQTGMVATERDSPESFSLRVQNRDRVHPGPVTLLPVANRVKGP